MEAISIADRPLPRPTAPIGLRPNATLVDREDVTPSIIRLRVRPDGGVSAFEPGQYLALGVEEGGRTLQRPYSTASARGVIDTLEFLVKLVPGGALTPLLWAQGPGSRMSLGRPRGRFVPEHGEPRRPLLIATGTGIAPLMSMLESRLRERRDGSPRQRPIVVHGVAHASELAYHDRLRLLADRRRITYVPAVSRPAEAANVGWAGMTGRVDGLIAGVLEHLGVDRGAAVAYLCGNPAMVDAVSGVLTGWGMPPGAVHAEAYWARPAAG